MIRYHFVTLFPEWFDSPLRAGLFARARQNGVVDAECVNPRDFAHDPHHTVDDRPYGGGPGMVLMLEPLLAAVASISHPGRIIALTPAGRPLTQKLAQELAREEDITLLCGRYEGFDDRLFDLLPVERVSVGDAVLNGGETAALAVMEATARLQEGFMGKLESGDDESFSDGLLEHPHYTRPEEYHGLGVPEPLRKGDHAAIAQWRRAQSLRVTWEQRPELLDNASLAWSERRQLAALKNFNLGKNIHFALLHHPVLLKERISGTSSLTNLDIHDIARISCTYGLGSLFVVTPLEDQMHLLETLLRHWTQGAGASSNPDRAQALRLVRPAPTLEEAVRMLTEQSGVPPTLIGTSARPELDKKGRERRKAIPFSEARALAEKTSVLILLGTGHGLAPEALALCGAVLPPLRWMSPYNHLPVRAAAAIILDRILGDRG